MRTFAAVLALVAFVAADSQFLPFGRQNNIFGANYYGLGAASPYYNGIYQTPAATNAYSYQTPAATNTYSYQVGSTAYGYPTGYVRSFAKREADAEPQYFGSPLAATTPYARNYFGAAASPYLGGLYNAGSYLRSAAPYTNAYSYSVGATPYGYPTGQVRSFVKREAEAEPQYFGSPLMGRQMVPFHGYNRMMASSSPLPYSPLSYAAAPYHQGYAGYPYAAGMRSAMPYAAAMRSAMPYAMAKPVYAEDRSVQTPASTTKIHRVAKREADSEADSEAQFFYGNNLGYNGYSNLGYNNLGYNNLGYNNLGYNGYNNLGYNSYNNLGYNSYNNLGYNYGRFPHTAGAFPYSGRLY